MGRKKTATKLIGVTEAKTRSKFHSVLKYLVFQRVYRASTIHLSGRKIAWSSTFAQSGMLLNENTERKIISPFRIVVVFPQREKKVMKLLKTPAYDVTSGKKEDIVNK